ncbi:succinate dehydrogenase/Fumarate reductase transmembrane subunit [bacterium BMS3Abin07]|nr:succinate dehydrogenase/Fumarate reductase transmembrane subunit [bacterium BMS3Abin07]GBE33305.1 succinate dehydrogenase/Fumarate reductase transmembrane subunit [bacterium BMS3Bbin05]HDO21651.1 succinate dehydrogenase cytochrome b subunit [Nitrospirota bacterium]HDZ87146.1 succinate dehydrogenase cytochrome b subunit [Nitrospirota bacterium]
MKSLIKNAAGRKIFMAVTGQLMVLFIIIHVIGNSTIYFGVLNSYADHLHAVPFLLWVFRLVMLTVFLIHVLFGILLTLDNCSARPGSYAVRAYRQSTFASRNMIWTGLLICLFLFYHLLHFTFQIIRPEVSAGVNSDAMGRPDVFNMLVMNFQHFSVTLIYILAIVALVLHLSHGIQSSFQTLGLNNERTLPVITKGGSIVAYVLFFGYIAIPVMIFIGILHG